MLAGAAQGFEPVAGGDLAQVAARRLAAPARRGIASPRRRRGDARRGCPRARPRSCTPSATGTGRRRGGSSPPPAASRSNTHDAAVAGSACTRPLSASASSAGPSRSGGAIATPLPRWRSSPAPAWPVHEQRDAAVLAQDREGQRQRRVRHVAAADVEQPGDRFRHRQHRRRDPVRRQRLAEPGALRLGGSRRRSAAACGTHRRDRRRRPASPHRVERVVVDRAEGGAGALDRGRSRSTSCGVCSHGS